MAAAKLLSEFEKYMVARDKARATLLRIADNPKHAQHVRDNARYGAMLLRKDGD